MKLQNIAFISIITLISSVTLNALGQSNLQTFEQQAIQRHNILRQKHGVNPLTLDKTLSKKAQNWALHLAQTNKGLFHSNTGPENIFWAKGLNPDGNMAVQAWYDEIKLYNFKQPGFSHGTGHFTQVVWKSATLVGCGKAQAKDGGIFIVCNYNTGNVLGQFPENVPPPR